MKTLIFTITTGRSGTVFLTDFWQRNLPDARVVHEHQQWWAHGVDTPDHSDMAHFNHAGVTPKIRAFWRRKFERILAEAGAIYAEASHYLAKAGLIENLDLLPADVRVKIVFFKRDAYKTARSLFNLGEFQNPASAWVWLPPAAENAIIQPGQLQQLGRAGMVLWYVLEMHARGAYYRELLRERAGCDFLETGPEALADEAAARQFLGDLLDSAPSESVIIPPPRNEGQSRNVASETEQAEFDDAYRRVGGDAEEAGRNYYGNGSRLARGPAPPPDPMTTSPQIVLEQVGAVRPERGHVLIDCHSGVDPEAGQPTGQLLVPASRYAPVVRTLTQARDELDQADKLLEVPTYFFVTGYNKSGTTFLQMLLDAHPNIHCPPEHSLDAAMELLQQFEAQYQAKIRGFDERTAQQGLRYDRQRVFETLFRTFVTTQMETGSEPEHSRRGVNDNRLLGSPELYSALFPDAQFLVVVRDPREAALSLWHHNRRIDPEGFREVPLEAYVPACADRWAQYVRGAERLQALFGETGLRIVRYEDLIGSERESVLHGVLSWLDVEASDAAVQACFGYTDKVRRKKQADHNGGGFFRAGQVATWRDEVPSEAIQQLEARCAAEMRRMGYERAFGDTEEGLASPLEGSGPEREGGEPPEPSATPPPVETVTLQVGGCPVHGLKSAVPGERHVLLLHGRQATAQTWEELGTLEALRRAGWPALALDLPGYGRSPGCSHPVTQVLVSLLRQFERPPVVVGPSFAGRYALEVALAAPDAVGGLVLAAPSQVEALQGRLAEIVAPTLVIWGGGDEVVPVEQAAVLERGLADSERVTLAEAGHASYRDQPEAWHQALLDFLARRFEGTGLP